MMPTIFLSEIDSVGSYYFYLAVQVLKLSHAPALNIGEQNGIGKLVKEVNFVKQQISHKKISQVYAYSRIT